MVSRNRESSSKPKRSVPKAHSTSENLANQSQPTSDLTPSVQRARLNPRSLTAANVLQLQGAIGNRSMAQILAQKATKPRNRIQRHSVKPEKEEEEIRAEQDEEEVLRKPLVQRAAGASFQPGGKFERQLAAQQGRGQPLSAEIRSFMEPRFGTDFSRVRIHTGDKSARLNQEISAQAFTHGSDIFMGAGKFKPETGEGKHLLVHELTHTIQQGGSPAAQIQPKKKRTAAKIAGGIAGGLLAGVPMAALGALGGLFAGGGKGAKGAASATYEKLGNKDKKWYSPRNLLAGVVAGFAGLGGAIVGAGAGAVLGAGAGLYGGATLGSELADTHWRNKGEDYNVPLGGELPTAEELSEEHIEDRLDKIGGTDALHTMATNRQIQDVMPLLRDENLVDQVLREAQEEAEAKGKEVPTEHDKLDFRLEFANVVVASETFSAAFGAYVAQIKGKDRYAAKAALLNGFTKKVQEYSRIQVKEEMSKLVPEVGLLDSNFSKKDVTKKFWAERKDVKLEKAYLEPDEKVSFATALKDMPTVKFLLSGEKAKEDVDNVGAKPVGWKDGGSLVDNIKEVDDFWKIRKAFNKVFDPKRGQKRLKSKTFRQRVQAVDTMMKVVVAPEILAQIPKPELHVHSTAAKDFDTIWGFRAWASGGKELHVAYNEATNVIAHEIGHIIEEYLPSEVWHDVHLLLGTRHQASGGGTAKAGATPIITTFGEGRYGGEYVTGKYTSTAYKGGNAEVISMAMEFFANPKDALKLIEGDPLHAAIVLRGIKPAEYQATNSLRAFDKFLPYK